MASRRSFVIFGAAAALSSCAQVLSDPLYTPDWRDMKRGGEVMLSGPVFERVRRVGQSILMPPPKGPPWEVGVVTRAAQLAKAFQGNGMIVSTAMVDACENDGQLAAVMFWATHFIMPSGRTNLARELLPNEDAIATADKATLQALARVGYDPRDGLVWPQRLADAEPDELKQGQVRVNRIKAELNKLGYQI